MRMPHLKPKPFELNLSTNGLRLPYQLSNLLAGTLKDYGLALVHLTNSNSFVLPQTSTIQQ